MRSGDFSGQPSIIYDPLTLSGNIRQPFPNNRIPADRFNAAGKGLIDLYPDPNRPGLVNNYTSDASRIYDSWQTDFKVDQYLTQTHVITFRGSIGNTDIIEGLPLPLPAAASVGPSKFPATQLSLIDRFTFSPTTLNEFRAGWTRLNMQLLQPNAGPQCCAGTRNQRGEHWRSHYVRIAACERHRLSGSG